MQLHCWKCAPIIWQIDSSCSKADLQSFRELVYGHWQHEVQKTAAACSAASAAGADPGLPAGGRIPKCCTVRRVAAGQRDTTPPTHRTADYPRLPPSRLLLCRAMCRHT